MFNDVLNHPSVKKRVRALKGDYQKCSALVRKLELPNQDDIQRSINDGAFKAQRDLINSIDPSTLVWPAEFSAPKQVPEEATKDTATPAASDSKSTKPGKGGKKKADDLM